jgi:predicted ATPase
MVENPELHLHPAGQSAMGVFLARAAAAGAQVIIETHSDHILNGIRKAVKGVDGAPILTPEQVAIHFFQPRDDAGQRPQVISPVIDPQGNLDTWPTDFFDQFDKDLGSLIGW